MTAMPSVHSCRTSARWATSPTARRPRSRIYERMPKRFYVRVLFTTCTKIICRVEFGDMSDLNAELKSQTEDKWGDWDDEEDKFQF